MVRGMTLNFQASVFDETGVPNRGHDGAQHTYESLGR